MGSHVTPRTRCLAGLLHDLGKFKQRAQLPQDQGLTHGKIGHEWLQLHYDDALVAEGARSHHGSDELVWKSNDLMVLYEADNCSASERRTTRASVKETSATWQRSVPLACVFSRVHNPHEDPPTSAPPPAYWTLPLKNGIPAPWHPPTRREGENSEAAYRQLWEAFERDFEKIKSHGNHQNVDVLLHLLEKYTGAIPSMTLRFKENDNEAAYRKHPDISLYDHLKTTAAFSVCLADYYLHKYEDVWDKKLLREEITGEASWSHDADCPFFLVGGDLSGVQRFIYTISSKGALKSLKGRSFFLELFLEHAVDTLLEALGLFRCNVIFTGGGHFYLVAPNLPRVESTLQTEAQRLNEYLFRDFNGTLELFVRWVPFRKADLRDVSGVWQQLAAALEEAKKRKGEAFLKELLAEPKEPNPDCYVDKCQVCGREDLPLKQLTIREAALPVCEPCRDQYVLGDLLQRASRRGAHQVIHRWRTEPKGLERDRYVKIDNRYYQPAAVRSGELRPHLESQPDAVYHLNDWDLAHYTHPGSRPLFAGIYLPPENAPQDLESMAQKGFGMERIAVLRMDVDRLGRIFSQALPHGERTFSLTAALSRQFSLFFKHHINAILEGADGYPAKTRLAQRPDGPRLLSLVYSGGDDLFLIGHWLDILEAALDIQSAFSQFTANPFITVSAGMAVGSAHEPVYRLADAAGFAEEQAKSPRREGGQEVSGRRAFTLLGSHTFPWKDDKSPDVTNVLKALQVLQPFVEIDSDHLRPRAHGLSKGFFYRLLQLVRLQRRQGVWALPKLAYLFGRTRVAESLEKEWMALKNYMFSSKADGWRHVEAALLILLMMMRKEETKDERGNGSDEH
ncbi:type III-A CRISPR-associated protein Cas10/Csm1 [Desulfosoma caldarium]|uniref:CRISPR system single-strand-specific deoxyribonuclease Cas10/Csm1 (subtype III-A) n=1 Tax=Desulfosoma caldarium TaxID=610254 RepID=A0A3N1URL9_9BACT|nr:type III-A CRISPR-associated protein Cas10/Csm1 [Desulfosoma caldarium]ROQ92049.1 CRISPR-associated protein Csm1 [Desulfosoma caldarium]